MTKRKTAGRLLQFIIVLFGISFLTFCLIYLAPGDPVKAMYAANGSVPSEEVLKAMREKMGLNDPFLMQYFNWLFNCLHGDFGTSYSLNKPVVTVLLQRLWPTLKLTLFSMILMLAVSVPFGVISAVKRNKAADYIIRVFSFAGISLPGFWLGVMLIYIVALKLKLLPVISNDTGIKKLILPAVTLAFSMAAKYTRQVRAAVLEELHKDYVVGARTRGIKESTVYWAHVFPNALLPLVTLAGLSLGSLLGGTAVVEVIFSYPGLGSLAVSAVAARDYPLIQGYVLWTALIYMSVNLAIDLLYGILDPRTKER
ncbi:nickel ABC transporter permease [Lacrimispora amygdalina]|uniref:nickel ABC transporter permease n=1 Tax=Lacrimispora TaxID=2719231 RepID=UPI001FA90807|nr:nickel ABC transporter permease [Lacrimispora amygdalina]MDK2966936.1 peptide/nickel transport system permease protein [Lacrimispora sp.]